MLDVIRKAEYFQWWERELANRSFHELKGTQDAWVLSRLSHLSGARIAEIGGGHSRVLPKLSHSNECWNIEKFEGVGGGPKSVQKQANVTLIDTYLGDFDSRLPNSAFDVVFSVSVVEHVPEDRLRAFFLDGARLLKPGGMFLHAIDLYVLDAPHQRNEVVDRYARIADDPEMKLKLLEPASVDSKITFRSEYASNSDGTLAQWNQIAPHLRSVREIAQSISLRAIWLKQS